LQKTSLRVFLGGVCSTDQTALQFGENTRARR
jgi:hypothetical protein